MQLWNIRTVDVDVEVEGELGNRVCIPSITYVVCPASPVATEEARRSSSPGPILFFPFSTRSSRRPPAGPV